MTVLTDSERAAWLLRRHSLLTASDAAAVFGMHGSKTRADVLREKRLPSPVDNEEIGKMNQVRAGRYLEQGIVQWFAADYPLSDVVDLPADAIYVTPQYERLAATPDALCDGAPLEVKNVGEGQIFHWSVVGLTYSVTAHNGRPAKCTFPGRELPKPLAETFFPAFEYVARPHNVCDDALTEWRALRGAQKTAALDLTAYGCCAPLKYWVQLQIQMLALSATRGWITAAIGGTSRLDLLYVADCGFQAWAIEQAKQFWRDL